MPNIERSDIKDLAFIVIYTLFTKVHTTKHEKIESIVKIIKV